MIGGGFVEGGGKKGLGIEHRRQRAGRWRKEIHSRGGRTEPSHNEETGFEGEPKVVCVDGKRRGGKEEVG